MKRGLPRPAISRLRVVAIVMPLLLGWGGCGVLRGVFAYYGVAWDRVAVATLDAALRPYDEWFLPDGAGPFPAVMLLPGCVGTQPFEREWARSFARAGYVALIVDSFTSRGVTSREALDAVCEGDHVWGFERAGDLLVSLDRLRAHPAVAADRLALVGWSHGAWAVMDAVALGASGDRPPLLDRLPSDALVGVRAALLFYPYCGFGSFTRELGWSSDVSGLMFLASRDENIPPGPCGDSADALRTKGLPFETVVLDADHWFDNPSGFDLVPHAYDLEATARVRDRMLSLLEQRLRPTFEAGGVR